MADSIDIKITGIEGIQSSIKELIYGSPEDVKRGVLRVAMKIERQAKATCPVLTGRLRASISQNWTGSGKTRGDVDPKATAEDGAGQPITKPNTFAAVVGTNVKYARRIEFGFMDTDKLGRKYNQQPQPYLYPAYFSYEADVADEVKAELAKRLAKILKK